MPRLTITADSKAETFVGATGWASGSQLLTGTSPALTANPKNDSRKIAQPTCIVKMRAQRTAARSNSSVPAAPATRMNAIATAMVPASLIANMTKPACELSSTLVFVSSPGDSWRSTSAPMRRGTRSRHPAMSTSTIEANSA